VRDHILETGSNALILLEGRARREELLLGGAAMSVCAVEDEGTRPIGPRGREKSADRTAFRKAEQGNPVHPDGVQHCLDVPNPFLERWHVWDRIGKTGARLVIEDQA
jgi:hypothetical protein